VVGRITPHPPAHARAAPKSASSCPRGSDPCRPLPKFCERPPRGPVQRPRKGPILGSLACGLRHTSSPHSGGPPGDSSAPSARNPTTDRRFGGRAADRRSRRTSQGLSLAQQPCDTARSRSAIINRFPKAVPRKTNTPRALQSVLLLTC
jgi:hypothetical protein